MSAELAWLAAALVLAVVQIFAAAAAKRRQDGMQWAAGSRDEHRTYTGVAARLDRAEKNLFETLWIFAVAVLIAHAAAREGALTLWGARIYVLTRIAYVPVYASGISMWRSVVWGFSMFGVVLVLAALF